jgi:hypothetical protein
MTDLTKIEIKAIRADLDKALADVLDVRQVSRDETATKLPDSLFMMELPEPKTMTVDRVEFQELLRATRTVFEEFDSKMSCKPTNPTFKHQRKIIDVLGVALIQFRME